MPSPDIRRSYRLDGNVALAIAAERSRSTLGFISESDGDPSGIVDKDTGIEIVYSERTSV